MGTLNPVNGYVELHRGARRRSRYLKAHRIVWEAVNGPIPEGKEINHRNGIKSDNRIDNLELATRSENLAHAYRMRLKVAPRGEAQGTSKLTAGQVEEIRLRHRQGAPQNVLAREYGVSTTTVWSIVHGRTWKPGPAVVAVRTPLWNEENVRAIREKYGDPADYQRFVTGEAHLKARLTASQVLEIRERLAAGEFGSYLAAEFGVNHNTIYAIRDRRTWAAVGGPPPAPARGSGNTDRNQTVVEAGAGRA